MRRAGLKEFNRKEMSLQSETALAQIRAQQHPIIQYGLYVGLDVHKETVAELRDITRFDSPRQLIAYLGLVPSEYSSGKNTRRGGITKTDNGHVRRVLIESAWCYRFAARKTAVLQRRAEKSSEAVKAIAWKAQKRLCGHYRHLMDRGLLKVKVCTAIARELTGTGTE